MTASKAFVAAYIEAALWSECVDSSEGDDTSFLDAGYDASDLADEARESIQRACDAFCEVAAVDLASFPGRKQWSQDECAGHDFWLTRNGHGAGFRDRGLGDLGDRLSEVAKRFGGSDAYLGDDGKIYVTGSEVAR